MTFFPGSQNQNCGQEQMILEYQKHIYSVDIRDRSYGGEDIFWRWIMVMVAQLNKFTIKHCTLKVEESYGMQIVPL